MAKAQETQSVRKIAFTPEMIKQYLAWLEKPDAAQAEFPVRVDWPELALTEEQRMANAVAIANDEPQPFPDLQRFSIVLPLVKERRS